MEKTIKLKLDADLDISKVSPKVARLNAEIQKMNSRSMGNGELPAGIDRERLAEYRRIAAELRRIDESNYKAQIEQAKIAAQNRGRIDQETARQATAIKKSELKVFEDAERAKQRIAEISAKSEIAAANNAARAIEATKKREYQEYVRLEKDKSRAAEVEEHRRLAASRPPLSSHISGGVVSGAGNLLVGAAVALPVAGFLTDSIQAAKESADALGQLEARLKSMGDTSGRTAEQLQSSAKELMRMSTFDDDDILRKVTASLLTFGKISGSEFDRAQKAAVNLSTAFGTDLQSATLQIGKALNDPIKGITALSRAGVSFTADQKNTIKTLVETGKAAEAQRMILSELEKEFGGAAQAAKANDPFAVMRDSINDLKETIGGNLLQILGQVTPYITQVTDAFNNASPAFQQTATVIGLVAAAFGTLAGLGIAPELGAVIPVLAGIAAAAPVIAVGYGIYKSWSENIGGIKEFTAKALNDLLTLIQPALDEIKTYAIGAFADVKAWIDTNLPTLINAVKNVVNDIRQLWAEHGEQITAIVKASWEIVKTIISTVGQQIGNVILLVANIINGDWKGVWENFKSILDVSIKASWAILKGLGTIVWEILKGIGTKIENQASEFYYKALELGKNIVKGLAEGIENLASNVYEKAKTVANKALNMISSVFDIHSPSRQTFALGQYVSEGLALGIESGASLALAASKKLALEVIKNFKDAKDQFLDFAKLSPSQQSAIAQTDNYSQGKNDLQEVIRLRNRLGENLNRTLPSTTEGAAAELKYLQEKIKAADDAQKLFDKSLEDIEKGMADARNEAEKYAEQVEKYKEALSSSGTDDSIRMQKEIALMGISDEVQKQQIENYYELIALRKTLMSDNYADEDIKDILRIKAAIQGENLELVKLEQQKQEQIEAAKELADAQKKAAEEAAAAMRDTWNQTYDQIRDILDTLTDRTMSFGDKFKSIFGGIANKLKSNLLETVS